MTDRMARVGEALKREISVIIQTEIEDRRLEGLTITRVEVARDLSLAKVFFEPSELGAGKAKELASLLAMYARFIRGELCRRVPLKFMPKLSFREDVFERYRETVDRLLERIKEGGEENEPEGNGSSNQ